MTGAIWNLLGAWLIYQLIFRLGNQYAEDSGLQSCLEYFVPKETLDKMRGGLEEWGQRCVGDLQEMGTQWPPLQLLGVSFWIFDYV